MKTHCQIIAAGLMFVAIARILEQPVQADTFGSGSNAFTIDFVSIGDAGNAADTTGYGAVPYEYRIGKYEVSQAIIDRATSSGLANVTAGAWAGHLPAANISWYEAAAFINWLNTSTGKQAAYNMSWNGSAWSMSLWSSADAWQLGGENLYRNKDAYYFMPSEDEHYKAAFYNPSGADYYVYPTASDIAPAPVAAGTNAGTAVYMQPPEQGPTEVYTAGGLSPYGTMGQGGNVYELNETAIIGPNDDPTMQRVLRGGSWNVGDALPLSSENRTFLVIGPTSQTIAVGFRVASIPEPSTYALVLVGTGALWLAGRRR